MGLQIEDGTGTGNQVEVKNNKLLISGVVSSTEHFANHNKGLAFNVPFQATPTGADDCFFYMKNLNKSLNIIVEGIWLKDASDEYIEVKIEDTGAPINGVDIIPVNMNTDSGNSAEGTFQQGSDITGLSGGLVALKLYHASSLASNYTNFEQDIVLGSNGVLSLYAGTGTTEIDGVIVMNYHEVNN